ncbi:MAG: ABC transporter substrate-binding protein [Thermoplasmata archaeon]
MRDELLISIDDTDVKGGEGTGRLARRVAAELDLELLGITRHQLLLHPLINYTKRNSCNVIIAKSDTAPGDIFETVREIIFHGSQRGSDPGLAVAWEVPESIREFGRLAQRSLLKKEECMRLAAQAGVALEEIKGNGQGIIGALAGIGLCSTGSDGRYIMLEGLRELKGTVSIADLEGMGIRTINLEDGKKLEEGLVAMAERIRPNRIDRRPILFVIKGEGAYYPTVL